MDFPFVLARVAQSRTKALAEAKVAEIYLAAASNRLIWIFLKVGTSRT